ncbi:hypothetical protein [Shimia sp. FJ5]|uniref:hypothetical protein n=1 Tax=Shimia sp. FJ5 TaxID=3079054 RepID=UPI00263296ED|nr:hypothetical protein [Shimia sp. FJ5]MDV4143452.1 hypothetical protein [Shimia sp. FJ5]
MKHLSMGVAAASLSLAATSGLADPRLTWEGSLEIGIDSVVSSDVAGNEVNDLYGIVDVAAEWALTDNVTLFVAGTGESMTGAVNDRAFEDLGFYLGEIGLSFGLGNTTLTVGKTGVAFGSAWDSAAGFYASGLADDYELTEQIVLAADIEIAGGTLSIATFYADDTIFSEQLGFNVGPNVSGVAGSGAGNTGQFDNLAINWAQELDGGVFYNIGARHLSGNATESDETGFVAGVGGTIGTVTLFGEVGVFDNYGGTAGDDATYALLNASRAFGDITLSGSLALRDVTSAGETKMATFGADYTFKNGVEFGGAVAFIDDAGVNSTQIGAAFVIPFGG